MTSASDPDSSYTIGYDNANRLTSVDNNGTPGIPRVILTYGYDNANRLTSLGDNLTPAGSIAYGYDNANRLTSLAMTVGGASGPNVALGYDNANRETSITRTIGGTGNSISSTIGYDNADRLTSITHSSSVAGNLMSLTYGYDAASRVTTFTGPEGTLNYGYDNTDQLTSVTGARTEAYGYDLNGNRNTTGYTTTTGNRMTSDGTYNYTFDNEGNVLTKTRISDSQKWEFTWDYRNRLSNVKIKNAGGTVLLEDRFTYDVWDHRIGKWVDADGAGPGAGVQSWTAYASDNPYADFDSAGSLTMRYLFGLGLAEIYARRDSSGNVGWHLGDMLGSVRQIVTTSGTVLDAITYDSFGNILSESNPSNGDRFKFVGMQWDSEIGQYYVWYRHYFAGPGRFVSEDPLGLAPDTNPYRYVGNGPLNSTDPSGLEFGGGTSVGAGRIPHYPPGSRPQQPVQPTPAGPAPGDPFRTGQHGFRGGGAAGGQPGAGGQAPGGGRPASAAPAPGAMTGGVGTINDMRLQRELQAEARRMFRGMQLDPTGQMPRRSEPGF